MAKTPDATTTPEGVQRHEPLSPFWAIWEPGFVVAAGPARKAAASGAPIRTPVPGVAVVGVGGVLEKRESFFSSGTSYLRIQQAMNAALEDKSVEEIMLLVSSPGGSVEGMAETGDLVRSARAKKRVTTFIDGMGASAAYYIGAQANEVVASRDATVGSIGIISYLYDMSAAFKKEGIKPVVISTGEAKGTGIPGTEVTKVQHADIERMVNFHFEDFKDAIVQGRRMDPKAVEAVATGEVWPAPEAVTLNLVDRIATFDETLGGLAASVKASARNRGRRARFKAA